MTGSNQSFKVHVESPKLNLQPEKQNLGDLSCAFIEPERIMNRTRTADETLIASSKLSSSV